MPILSKDTTLCISLAGRPSNLGTRFHNRLYEELGLDFVYKAFTTDDIEGAIRGVRALGIRGCSVSMPFKSAVLPLVDEVEESASAIDAANTIVNTGGRLTAANTDVEAVEELLRRSDVPRDSRVLIQGSGSMAAAVTAAFRHAGFGSITITARNADTGRALADRFDAAFTSDAGTRGRRARQRHAARDGGSGCGRARVPGVVDPSRDQGVRRGGAPRRDAADPGRAAPRASRCSPAPRCTPCRPPVSSSATPGWRSPRIRWRGRAHSREGNDLSHSYGNATRIRDSGTPDTRLAFFHSRYPGRNGDRKNSMIQPVRLLAAVTVCAALLIPARIAFSAQTATAVTGSTTQVASGH